MAPAFILEELQKYSSLIQDKTKRSKDDLQQFIILMKNRLSLIQPKQNFLKLAEQISPDDKDITYIALALQETALLWSNDKKLKEQDKVQVLSTPDLLDKLDRTID